MRARSDLRVVANVSSLQRAQPPVPCIDTESIMAKGERVDEVYGREIPPNVQDFPFVLC